MTGTALAYVTMPARLMIVGSSDGSALLRIDHGVQSPNSGAPPQPAHATVFRFDPASKVYRTTGTFALRNPIAPMTAMISDGAEFIVTCDDYKPMIGCTPNVVVVYRGSGEIVKAWSLEDIFSPAEIMRFGPFAMNVPLRPWRGDDVRFVTDSKGPAVWIPNGRTLPWLVDLRLDLISLTFEKYPVREMDK